MDKQDFYANIKTLSDKVSKIHKIDSEETTKTSLIMPFLIALGYDVFDPTVVISESTADIGSKRGEKVDYAINVSGKKVIIIEAKRFGILLTNT